MNDQISSIRVGPDTAATVFKNAGYSGTDDVIYLDTPRLDDSDVGNDTISSLSIVNTPAAATVRLSATSRLTQEPSVENGKVVERPVLRSVLTLPPLSGAVDVWATEELEITVGGTTHRINPVRPARLMPDDTGKLIVLMDPEALGGGALMIRTPVRTPRQRVFVFPDVDYHTKLLAMDDDALWRDRAALGLDPSMTREDAVQAGRALKALSSAVPSADRSLSHGTSRDRLVVTDRMTYERWALDFGGTGGTRFRPAGAAELARVGAGAIDLDDQAAQAIGDRLKKWGGKTKTFFVEKVPNATVSAFDETTEFFGEDLPGALEDAGDAVVNFAKPIATDIADASKQVWDDGTDWVEQAAADIAAPIVKGAAALRDGVVQVASDAADVFDELAKGVGEALGDIADAVLRITVEIGGKVYRFVADTVEITGKVLRKVLDGLGVVLGKLTRVLMDLFGFDDVPKTHDHLIGHITSGLDVASGAIGKLKSETALWFTGLQNDMVSGLDAAIEQFGGGDIASANRDRPGDRSEAMDKIDWLFSKLIGDLGSAMPLPGRKLKEGFDDVLDAVKTSASDGAPPENPFMDKITGAANKDQMSQVTGILDKPESRLAEFIEGDFGIVVDSFFDSIALFRAAVSDLARATGHGTFTAGLTSRVAPSAHILAAQVIEGGATIWRLLAGIDWALERLADVIVLPLGFRGHHPVLRPALLAVRRAGVLAVAAVGNGGAGRVLSPGCFPEVLSVGAGGALGCPAAFSGSTAAGVLTAKPDILARGICLHGPAPGGGSVEMSGTSAAAAIAAGVIAVLASARDISPITAAELLCAAARPLPSERAHRSVHGTLDPVAAMDINEGVQKGRSFSAQVIQRPINGYFPRQLDLRLAHADVSARIDVLIGPGAADQLPGQLADTVTGCLPRLGMFRLSVSPAQLHEARTMWPAAVFGPANPVAV